jgi:hypothetical protein
VITAWNPSRIVQNVNSKPANWRGGALKGTFGTKERVNQQTKLSRKLEQ